MAYVHSDLKTQKQQLAAMPLTTEEEVNMAQDAQNRVAYTQNQYELLVNEKVRSLLYDTTNQNPYDSIIYYLHTLGHTPQAHKAIALMYLQQGNYAQASAFVDTVKAAGVAHADFVNYHRALISAKQSPNYYTALKSNAVLKTQMLGYANNYYSEMNAGAKAFLKQFYGMSFTETILTPVQQSQIDRLAAGIQSVIALSDQVTLYPNPAQNNLTLDYTVDEKDAVTVFIRDISGKTVQSISLVGNTTSHAVDISLLSNGVYFVSLQKNGVITNTQKLIIVK